MKSPFIRRNGAAITSANNPAIQQESDPGSILIRGVVVAVYAGDEPTMLGVNDLEAFDAIRPVVYCDVLTYASSYWKHSRIIRRCIVLGNTPGLYDGRIWIPRAATRDSTTQATLTSTSATFANPSALDGDHVLVCFIDGRLDSPAILCGVPHPGGQIIAGTADVGALQYRHRGAVVRIDQQGNVRLDTTFSNDGIYTENNEEHPQFEGDSAFSPWGNILVNVKARANFDIRSPSFHLGLRGNGSFSLGVMSEDGASRLDMTREGKIILGNLDHNSYVDISSSGLVSIKAGEVVDQTTGERTHTEDIEYWAKNVNVSADEIATTTAGKSVNTSAAESINFDSPELNGQGGAAVLGYNTVDVGSNAIDHAILGDTLLTNVQASIAAFKTQTASSYATYSNPADAAKPLTYLDLAAYMLAVQAVLDQIQGSIAAATSTSVKIKA